MFEKLFENLANRQNSENALSDITWAFAQSDNTFRFLFLKFFFDDISITDNVLSFHREYRRAYSRPDFYIETNRGEYIIENKIFDRNHHFKKYQKSFPNAQFGYIANYKISNIDAISIRTWQGFYEYLINLIATKNDKDFVRLLKSYIAYLKPVCQFINIENMKLDSLYSLPMLNAMVANVINNSERFGEIKYYEKTRSLDYNRYGRFYGLKKVGSKKVIWPWIGVWFTVDEVVFYIEISQKWFPKAFAFLKASSNLKDGEFYLKPYFDDTYLHSFAFELKETHFKEFNSIANSKEQEKLLKSFIFEVFDFIDEYI